MKKIILTLGLISCSNAFTNPNESLVWQDFSESAHPQIIKLSAKNSIKKRSLILDVEFLKNNLAFIAQQNKSQLAAKSVNQIELNLPLPNGDFVRVSATDSPILSPEMAEQHPDIKTWKVAGIDDPAITGRIDFTLNGFHAMLTMADGDTVFIDPDEEQGGNVYNSLSKKENSSRFHSDFNCQVHDEHDLRSTDSLKLPAAKVLASTPALNLKTYRLAVAGTGEYTASQGGSKSSAYASMVTTINRVNEIYERDIGLRLELVSGEDLIYTNAATDPYTNNDANALVIENMSNMDVNFGVANFDLGHVFAQGPLGGLAFVGVACLNSANTSGGMVNAIKAGGATGTIDPRGEIFSIEYVAHEIGHQIGATHTFNSTQNGCGGGNRTAETAVEPGSGSTIMSYSGLCGSDDLQYNSEAAFHFASISQINSYTRTDTGSSCGADTSTGNQNPVANAGSDVNIPANTPLILGGSSTGGSTFSWDQIDAGSASAVDVDMGDNAIIRALLPSSEEDRFIPRLSDLFAGSSTIGEKLPQTTRELNFAFVVRDGAGGIGVDTKKLNVTDTHSTFSVVSQSSNESLFTGENISVLWNTASTNIAPVNCNNVDIHLLRVNGVKNLLLASTDNDGIQDLVIPATTPVMSDARVMVACSDNSFFNISSGNISIEKGLADTTEPFITIKGVNPVSIPQGSVYTDAGATAVDNVDGNLTVSIVGTVDTAVVGAYTITYSATDSSGNTATEKRIVNVTSVVTEPTPPVTMVADTTPPQITLNGDSEITLDVGDDFSAPGYTAIDDHDDVVNVMVTGLETVDTSVAGVYTITYTAVDSAGNTQIVTRKIIVSEVLDMQDPQEIILNLKAAVDFLDIYCCL